MTKSYYANDVAGFLDVSTDDILGRLATQVGLEHRGDEAQQIRAWRIQIDLLKSTLSTCGTRNWGVLLELPLLRLGRRIDTIILVNDWVVCIEFKIGATRFAATDLEQANDYALCLRDFHGASRGRKVVPVLCADLALDETCRAGIDFIDDVSECQHVNAARLIDTLTSVASHANGAQINWFSFDEASYNPTPDIVSAARGLYAGHAVNEIGRADAPAHALQKTAERLREITEKARTEKKKTICFVTGEPGSGKTLLGLEMVLSGNAGRVTGEPAALLSGNRPLVFVLQAAIAEDARARLNIKSSEAKRQSQQALQTLLGYLKDHAEPTSDPPEHVIVFDEAQRAWNADTGLKLLGRLKSEPELFLEIMGRLPWACLVCLVGPGQEINRGEGGLALWGEALANSNDWIAHVSEEALYGSGGLIGLMDTSKKDEISVQIDPDLHLRTNLRAYRNHLHGKWVRAILDSNIDGALAIAGQMDHPPAYITRELVKMKAWLKKRRRGGQRVGILASSGATRLISDGIPPSPRSNELDQVVHWFLRPAGDFRSSNALEVPLSEFVCQGLEIDYTGLCWGNDLVWSEGAWVPRKMRAPKWQILKKEDARQYRINTYRVLLTRGRAGTAIYVPEGDIDDPTRPPEDFDGTYEILMRSGCVAL